MYNVISANLKATFSVSDKGSFFYSSPGFVSYPSDKVTDVSEHLQTVPGSIPGATRFSEK
jgi:hypothetical protein